MVERVEVVERVETTITENRHFDTLNVRAKDLAERGGFEPPVPFEYARLPSVYLKPLGHLSKRKKSVIRQTQMRLTRFERATSTSAGWRSNPTELQSQKDGGDRSRTCPARKEPTD